jgi:hypothetical protein
MNASKPAVALALFVWVLCACSSEDVRTASTAISDPVFHTGCCDASAGVALSGDLFVIANDEDNLLRVYRRDLEGGPVQTFDLGNFLRVDPKEPETDLEGAARLGDRIYWITSHGRSRTGKERSSRQRFFATAFIVSGDSVVCNPVGEPYAGLLGDLLKEPRLAPFNLAAAATKAPAEDGALNIEGLCGTPEGHLLIGFRNPIPGRRALIVPLLNPSELIEGKPARFGDPILLDLGGLGIRSLAFSHDRFLIAAGPHDGKGQSRIYEWAGGTAAPRHLAQINLRGINPEGLIIYPEGGPREFHLISDDGTVKTDGVECKHLKDPNARRFRSFRVSL